MRHTELPSHEAAILARLVGPEDSELSPAAAKGIMTLAFSQLDKDRMRLLSTRARDGKLTAREYAEVEAYSLVNSLLGVLKSKARCARRRRASNGSAKAH